MMNNNKNTNNNTQYINTYTVYKEMFSLFNRKRKSKKTNK